MRSTFTISQFDSLNGQKIRMILSLHWRRWWWYLCVYVTSLKFMYAAYVLIWVRFRAWINHTLFTFMKSILLAHYQVIQSVVSQFANILSARNWLIAKIEWDFFKFNQKFHTENVQLNCNVWARVKYDCNCNWIDCGDNSQCTHTPEIEWICISNECTKI